MPRKLRAYLPFIPCHVITRGNNVSAEPTTGLHSRAAADPHPRWSEHSVTE